MKKTNTTFYILLIILLLSVSNTFACIQIMQLQADKTTICKGDTVLFNAAFGGLVNASHADSIVWEFENGIPSHVLITTPSGARFDTSNWDNYKDLDDTTIRVVYNITGSHNVKVSLYSSMDNNTHIGGVFQGGSPPDGNNDVAYQVNSNFINVVDTSHALFKDDLLCLFADTLINLFAGSSGNTYSWSDGSSANTNLLGAGEHWVSVTNTGCSAIDTFTIIQSSITFDFDDTLAYCNAQSITLDAISANGDYTWSDASTNSSLNVNSEGFVWVEVTDLSTLCVFRDTTYVIEAPAISIDLGNDTCIQSTASIILDASNPGLTYQWSNGALSQTINGFTGSYSVIVFGAYGCEEGIDTIFIDDCNNPKQAVGIPTIDGELSIMIYPNPIENGAEIKISKTLKNGIFDLYNQMGQLVSTLNFEGKDLVYFDRKELPAGLYIYTVHTNAFEFNGKVLLK